jgi:hypothetical protein
MKQIEFLQRSEAQQDQRLTKLPSAICFELKGLCLSEAAVQEVTIGFREGTL